MRVIADAMSGAPGCAIGPRPDWVSAVFEDMYPDDAIAVPTTRAATVLACDEDWEWIAEQAAAVAHAIDDAVSAVATAGVGEWVIGRAVADGTAFMVCTAANSAGSAASGVGNVVLVLRGATHGIFANGVTAVRR